MGSRWAGLLAGGGVVVALALPGPVSAAAAPVVLRPVMADLTISGEIHPPVYLGADIGFLSSVELVFDLTGVAGIATVRFDLPCSTAATVVTCRFSGLVMEDGLFTWDPSFLNVAPVEGVTPGSHGTIVMSASADNATTGSHTVDVVVGTGVDLAIFPGTDPRVQRSTARAGDIVALPLRVQAVHEPVHGAAVVLDLPPLMRKADDFSNCRYLSTGPLACTFDTVLQPNVIYQLATPIKLRADPAFHEVFGRPARIGITWVTAAEYTHLRDLRMLLGQPAGQPGHGGRLTLQPVEPTNTANTGSAASATAGSSPAAAAPEADRDPNNNWQVLVVTVFARNAANFSATIAAATIGPKQQVHLRVGIKNNGPATANVPGGHANGAIINVPGDLTFHTTPPDCQYTPEEPQLPGDPPPPAGNYFWCPTGPLLRAGDTAWFDFAGTLHAARPGSIHINIPNPGDVQADPNPADDHATITLTPATPGGDGNSGQLPITGTPTIPISAAGLILLLAGTLLRYSTRQRRTVNSTPHNETASWR